MCSGEGATHPMDERCEMRREALEKATGGPGVAAAVLVQLPEDLSSGIRIRSATILHHDRTLFGGNQGPTPSGYVEIADSLTARIMWTMRREEAAMWPQRTPREIKTQRDNIICGSGTLSQFVNETLVKAQTKYFNCCFNQHKAQINEIFGKQKNDFSIFT